MGLVLVWCIITFCPNQWAQHSRLFSVLHEISREVVKGHLNGEYQGHPNNATFERLKPGDILLCHNQGGGYGYWTHAVLYIGGGRVVDSDDFAEGTKFNSVQKYRQYDELLAARVDITNDVRRKIVQNAKKEVGKPYDPFSGLSDRHSEYCSKLIWKVFDNQGIRLCPPGLWIL